MDFSHVNTWIFDLDNTLYPPEAQLFAQVQRRMTGYVMRLTGASEAEAEALRADWFQRHGTTLAGLMAEHGIDPYPYLDEVHDIDLSGIGPDPGLAAAIAALPGRRIVHTSADAAFAVRVLSRLALPVFEAIYGIGETAWHPKPDPRSYQAVLAGHAIDPARAAFFEDDARNLEEPHRLGMRTVLVGPAGEGRADHVHVQTGDLAGLLRGLAGAGVVPAAIAATPALR
ncbi:pyrimidine 5'-nucleotidase [Paracoccus sp. S-4012]|uniref:pyrimidine 5'-nucleotidase n=1 Tax=Paracoccus sp. S-4012 TaxID=2665648 RepID=UPI0012B05EE9|nr:pyrimidine 5'-nucleotidase [Paracoccus sp. S-4012]MRX51101.1 pyrimidine 5'-nucleotidase [Paracoccus sp. S-4012]